MSTLRRSVPSALAAVVASLTFAACHADKSLEPDAANAGGVWESVSTEAGTSEHWILEVQNGVVHGTGTWTGAACCGEGTLRLTGSALGDSLHLELTYFVTFSGDSLFVFRGGDHIDAALDSQTDLVGTRTMIFGPEQHGGSPPIFEIQFSNIHFRKASQ